MIRRDVRWGREKNINKVLRSYAIYLFAWTIVGVLYFAQDVARRVYYGSPVPWYEARFWSVRVIISAALTGAVLWLGRRWPIDRHNWPSRISIHLVCSVVFAFVRVLLEASVHAALNALTDAPWDRGLGGALEISVIFGFHTGVIAYWVVLSIQAAFSYYAKFREREQEALRLELRAAELRTEVAQAQLGALKTQLQPHFLFNTLNAIVVLVRQEKAAEAERALMQLSDLLRAVLDDQHAQEVPLRRELEYLRLYLAIEELRFSDRLEVSIETDPALLEYAVPQMALQPIVENAIRHGVNRTFSKVAIRVRAYSRHDELHIVVEDNGPGFETNAASKGHGVGLSNLRGRLQRLYGDRASLDICSSSGAGAKIALTLPCRDADDVQAEDVATRFE